MNNQELQLLNEAQEELDDIECEKLDEMIDYYESDDFIDDVANVIFGEKNAS